MSKSIKKINSETWNYQPNPIVGNKKNKRALSKKIRQETKQNIQDF